MKIARHKLDNRIIALYNASMTALREEARDERRTAMLTAVQNHPRPPVVVRQQSACGHDPEHMERIVADRQRLAQENRDLRELAARQAAEIRQLRAGLAR